MRYIIGDSINSTIVGEQICKWYKEKTGINYSNRPFIGVALYDNHYQYKSDNNIKGVLFFDNYEPETTISMHAYAPGMMSKSTIKFVFNYVFNTLNCKVFRCIVHIHNTNLIKTLTRLNFEKEALLSPYFIDGDGILFKLQKSNLPLWINLDERTKAAKAA